MEARESIEASVRERFRRLAADPASERAFPVGAASAKRLGYDPAEVDALPPAVSESFAGVGHPLGIEPLRPGESLLDLGCGAGFDAILAAARVGPAGRVVGVDFTPEMVGKARANARLAGAARCEFREGAADRIPAVSESFDVVLTNGVMNLCVDKPAVCREIARILRPGGRLQMADILLEPRITPEEVAAKGEWSG